MENPTKTILSLLNERGDAFYDYARDVKNGISYVVPGSDWKHKKDMSFAKKFCQ